MRFRSAVTVVAMLGALAAAVLRCAVPPSPPPSQALSTRVKEVRGAVVSLTGDAIDRDALVASLKELRLTSVVLQSAANQDGAFIQDRVALAIELQAKLDATVLLGTYQVDRLIGKPMEILLQRDATFATCYPGGRALDPNDLVIDKLRLCSEDVSRAMVDEMRRLKAPEDVGCYIGHEVELVDALPEDGRNRLGAFFHDSARLCREDKRLVLTSAMLSNRPIDHEAAATLFGTALQSSGVTDLVLRDGVGVYKSSDKPSEPRRAEQHYQSLRLALLLRSPEVRVWANVEAFDCEQPDCKKTHPTSVERFKGQICAATAHVDWLIATEYLHHLAGRPLVTATVDGSTAVQSIADDVDAAAVLRRGYAEWLDSGAPCPR